MTTSEDSRQVLARWYDDMWFPQKWQLVTELAGPIYTRHETSGTSQVTAEEYQQVVRSVCESVVITNGRYRLVAEDDRVAAIGSWEVDGKQWDWVQMFRVENSKLVETWLTGIAFESNWDPSAIRA